ncbi:transposase [Clostridium gasigenes]|uniref:transposase n=1 Tax=Clostridium gasigenes TaxID=94869 RepID=UPI001C0D0178|nr:transposase [Clostridium gasigenes]MBU3109811.1 transposase [Clostridium gasigenes]
MNFKSMLLFILNFVKKSLQIELDNFFKMIKGKDINITKQAFSEAREKISPTAFIKTADALIKWFYSDTYFNKYRGYRILSIDETMLEIHNSENLREEFGYIENKSLKVGRARGAALYDSENDIILTSHIGKYKQGEREVAEILIEKLCDLGNSNDLILFDRGYPSREFISFIEDKYIKYLMRVNTAFLKVVVNASAADQIVEAKYKNKLFKMRVLKFKLESGVTEILITNLFDNDAS